MADPEPKSSGSKPGRAPARPGKGPGPASPPARPSAQEIQRPRAGPGTTSGSLPLPSLLSQALVAFTIELDNEFEVRTPHRSTTAGEAARTRDVPWLVSLVMWSNFMRFVEEDGISVRELQNRTRLTNQGVSRWLKRMAQWWGYVVVAPDPSDPRPKPPAGDWVVRPTSGGRRAQAAWRPLAGIIEKRWEERFSEKLIGGLRETLMAIVNLLHVDLPEYLPVLGYGLFARGPQDDWLLPAPRQDVRAIDLRLPALLSQVLLAFTLEFESESELSLAICANLMRLLTEKGVPASDLPRLAGVSKEAIKFSLGFLEKRGCVALEPDAAAQGRRVARLTPKGREAQKVYRRRLRLIEQSWQVRFSARRIGHLRSGLEHLVGEPTAARSPLFGGLEPPPGSWRSSAGRPDALPHHPMVLHRGGFPDGA
jgi:DNA-binding MarR family transcriptional regulator